MTTRKIVPLDMAVNFDFALNGFDDKTREKIGDLITERHAEGR